ncbi:hypothetical protein [Bradyrhizobium sp. AUGA SZCCT0431]|uniref:hypothetical protein n=1 Tax=Bradyrhizobium sp. AUGA SZCCT0431 TaxID=2807674 RepID=UPI001BA454AB|nr:hypothetical protein [Bradyrhizobium sp. AUGA SZCCT0431]
MPAVTTAAEMLTYAAERRIAWMILARMVTLKAIHRHEVRQFNPDAKEHHWGKMEAQKRSVRRALPRDPHGPKLNYFHDL